MLGIGHQNVCGIKDIFRTVTMEINNLRKRGVDWEAMLFSVRKFHLLVGEISS